jgi:hypothetical protein
MGGFFFFQSEQEAVVSKGMERERGGTGSTGFWIGIEAVRG